MVETLMPLRVMHTAPFTGREPVHVAIKQAAAICSKTPLKSPYPEKELELHWQNGQESQHFKIVQLFSFYLWFRKTSLKGGRACHWQSMSQPYTMTYHNQTYTLRETNPILWWMTTHTIPDRWKQSLYTNRWHTYTLTDDNLPYNLTDDNQAYKLTDDNQSFTMTDDIAIPWEIKSLYNDRWQPILYPEIW